MPIQVGSRVLLRRKDCQHIIGTVTASIGEDAFLVRRKSAVDGAMSGTCKQNQLKLPPLSMRNGDGFDDDTSTASSAASAVATATTSGRSCRANVGRSARSRPPAEDEDDNDVPALGNGGFDSESDDDDDDDEPTAAARRGPNARRLQAEQEEEEEEEDDDDVPEFVQRIDSDSEEEAALDVNDSGDTAEINRVLRNRHNHRSSNKEDVEEFDADEFIRRLGDKIDPVSLHFALLVFILSLDSFAHAIPLLSHLTQQDSVLDEDLLEEALLFEEDRMRTEAHQQVKRDRINAVEQQMIRDKTVLTVKVGAQEIHWEMTGSGIWKLGKCKEEKGKRNGEQGKQATR